MLVGVFAPEPAASPASVFPIKRAVVKKGWECIELTTEDLETNEAALSGVNVLVLPGGEPRQMRNALSPAARRNLERWKQQTDLKGLIGICAGSVIACGRGQRGSSLVAGVRLVDDNRFATTGLSSTVKLRFDRPPLQLLDCLEADLPSKLKMPYVSGPLFAVEDCANQSTENQPSVSIVATYSTDVAGEELESLGFSTGDDPQTSASEWCCTVCQRVSKQKTCCGMKRREHEKQRKLLRQLTGVMPGKAAVVSVCDEAFRCVLFGPHPEMGNKKCVDLLTASMEWAAGG